jgi:hypothetical protein
MKGIVLSIPGFPTLDSAPCDIDTLLSSAVDGLEIEAVSLEALPAALAARPDVFITPYGSAFPVVAWDAFSAYLKAGGNWFNIGGSPLSRPVARRSDGTWHAEVSQTTLMRRLRINQAFPIDVAAGAELEFTDALQGAEASHLPAIARAWSLQVRFTDHKDVPHEHGSSGPRDAVIRTQCYARHDGRPVAAPIVLIDRLLGTYAGGRWLLVNAELGGPLSPELLARLLRLTAQGPVELNVRPSFACYYPGEQAALQVRVKASHLCGQAMLQITVGRDGDSLTTLSQPVTLGRTPVHLSIPLSGVLHVHPGLYLVRAHLVGDGDMPLATAETGFWGYNETLLTSGPVMGHDTDYVRFDGKPYPLAGTTYMAGDVQRKFLFEPNPALWNRDFAAMRASGVNIVRTGIWTAYKRVMLDSGALDEGVLRALVAFVHCARAHEIPVIFNFFGFLPEEWSGENPYLDPRSLDAQCEFVAAFAQRLAMVNDISWDLINEPSFSSHNDLWRTRPNYDAHERAAWTAWLQESAARFSVEESATADPADVWRERWRLAPGASLDMPASIDFPDMQLIQDRNPLRALDYRLFAQEMFNRWVVRLSEAIRANGNPNHLIAVGQDEGGSGERPNTHFHATVVDYTTVHSWWQNDDLLWDSIITKTAHCPNVIQETGIMFLENPDGSYRRTPEDAGRLVARKFALSLAAGCAGAIQWLWNTNYYMDSDNEVGIGFLRADGTEKPEIEAFRGFARFVNANRARFTGRKPEAAVLIIPHGAMFTVRDTADAATRRCVRSLEYTFGIAVRSVSEFDLDAIGDASTLFLPSPQVLSEECWSHLVDRVSQGATLVISGPIDLDLYWRSIDRLASLGVQASRRPVAGYEPFRQQDGTLTWVRFDRAAQERFDRAVFAGDEEAAVRTIEVGAGRILFSALPLELALNGAEELLYELLPGAKRRETPSLLHRRERFEGSTLHILVNESPVAQTLPDLNGIEIPGWGAALVFTDAATGEIVDSWVSAI